MTLTPRGVRLTVHVQPRARRTEVVGLYGDAIKLRVAAPPVNGAANEEIVRFFAEIFEAPKRLVTIEAGSAGRRKSIEIVGVEPRFVAERLGLNLPDLGTATRDRP